MSASSNTTLDMLLVSRTGPDGQPVPVVRVTHDGTRATITWLGAPDPSLLRLQTHVGPVRPEHGRPFLDALQRQLKHRAGWTCDRTRAA